MKQNTKACVYYEEILHTNLYRTYQYIWFFWKTEKKIDTRLSYQSIANFLQIAQHEHPIARPLQALLWILTFTLIFHFALSYAK